VRLGEIVFFSDPWAPELDKKMPAAGYSRDNGSDMLCSLCELSIGSDEKDRVRRFLCDHALHVACLASLGTSWVERGRPFASKDLPAGVCPSCHPGSANHNERTCKCCSNWKVRRPRPGGRCKKLENGSCEIFCHLHHEQTKPPRERKEARKKKRHIASQAQQLCELQRQLSFVTAAQPITVETGTCSIATETQGSQVSVPMVDASTQTPDEYAVGNLGCTAVGLMDVTVKEGGCPKEGAVLTSTAWALLPRAGEESFIILPTPVIEAGSNWLDATEPNRGQQMISSTGPAHWLRARE